MTLETLGAYDVCHCSNGKEALETLADFKPQLAILDVMMPEMDGVEVMQRMHEMPAGKNIPVIFMTAKAQVHEQQYYYQLGALDIIVKPYDARTVCNKIETVWQNTTQAA